MYEYEELVNSVESQDILIVDYDFSNTRFKALYCDGVIALDKYIENNNERKCILAEEIGHFYTTSGNILDQTNASNRKQELRARLWAYDRLVGLSGIVKAFKHGCESLAETAEYLNVTEEFLSDALKEYENKYGTSVVYGEYEISFTPTLKVTEKRNNYGFY